MTGKDLREMAIMMSNKAVRHLETNDYESASHLFRQGLMICQIVMKQIKTTVPQKKAASVVVFQWSSKIGMLAESSKADGNFVFSRGIFIHSLTTSIEMIKAVVCYNTALTHHLFTILDHNADLSLQRAKLLYSLSYQILKQQRSTQRHLKFFFIAILNNLGKVSFDLVDYQTSKKCFDQLRRNLVFILRTRKTTDFYQSDLIAMHFNTMLDVPMTAPCA